MRLSVLLLLIASIAGVLLLEAVLRMVAVVLVRVHIVICHGQDAFEARHGHD
jgi:hypothetical protein